jgi:hypothetical protein
MSLIPLTAIFKETSYLLFQMLSYNKVMQLQVAYIFLSICRIEDPEIGNTGTSSSLKSEKGIDLIMYSLFSSYFSLVVFHEYIIKSCTVSQIQ